MPKHLKKLSEEIIHKNPWYEYKHDQYELPNGKTGDYYYSESNGVVMIIPVLEDGRIALTLQYRYLADRQSIEFPAGGIKPETDTLTAAKIELQEETGCIAGEMVKLGEFEPSNGFIKDRTHVYLAQVSEQGAQQLDETEDIEVMYRRPDEIEEMIRRNDIWCGQSIAAWSLARHIFFKEKPEAKATTFETFQNLIDGFIGS